jgi:transcriptional regulator with XRE-family HTH domain
MKVDTAKIKRLREKKGLSQREAALAAGWATAQQWASIETGQRKSPSVQTFAAVARVLGCRMEELLRK